LVNYVGSHELTEFAGGVRWWDLPVEIDSKREAESGEFTDEYAP
jgi:hypothetical protein